MTKLILHGCNGRMGRVITDICREDDEVEIIAGIDVFDGVQNDYPVYSSLRECQEEADVIVDFCHAGAVDDLLDYCCQTGHPVVLCTTGLSEAQLERVEQVSEKVAVLKSANMSLGINMLMDLLKTATDVLKDAGFDIEIVEKHHNQKVDAPSGTALALADVMKERLGEDYHYQYDRSQIREKRDTKEIGISAVRGGNIVGEHEVIFAGMDEVITFKHTAYSKGIFAKGAVEAAKFLKGKPAGHYEMKDVIAARSTENPERLS